MTLFLAEFIGTAILILLGNGVVCNVVLSKTKGHDSGWIVIAAGWGMAVFIGAAIANAVSGAHLNPALTIALCAAGQLAWELAPQYIAAQMLGAMLGAGLVFLFYRSHFYAENSADKKLGCFSTAPAIPGNAQAFVCEVIGTFVLVFALLSFQSPQISLGTTDGSDVQAAVVATQPVIGLGTNQLIPVAVLIFAIGVSLGGTTGYAINPARDLGPRLMHFLLPIPGKGDSQWSYAWVPVLGPILGGVIAAIAWKALSTY